MILGSHNSLSYAKPTKWWMYLLRFTAKCQSVDIKKQIDLGIRYFDIRVRYDRQTGLFKPAHGSIIFDCSLDNAFKLINDVHGYVRILLEQNFVRKNQDYIDAIFSEFCAEKEANYTDIKFQYAVRKYDWKTLYTFKNVENILSITDKYSSTTGLFWDKTGMLIDRIDDFWPWLYAKLHNKTIIKENKDAEVLLIDFVNLAVKK